MNTLKLLVCLIAFVDSSFSQNFGNFPTLPKEQLQRDLDLLYQGLDQFHSGMYWYTSKDSVNTAFENAKQHLNRDLNVLEFYKIIAPLVALSREDHTDIFLPQAIKNEINNNETIRFLPLTVVFLNEKLYCLKNASNNRVTLEGLEIETINGETPKEIVSKLGNLFASDGYITSVKYNDLSGFQFSKYYYYYYGNVENYELKFKEIPDEMIVFEPSSINEVKNNLKKYYPEIQNTQQVQEPLEFEILNSKTAYLKIKSFSNSDLKKESKFKTLKNFLEKSFLEINKKGIEHVIIDVSENGGGTEGNEGLLYSYFGTNYQKYTKVRAKSQKVVLDNGIDAPIKLKTFGILERLFTTKKMDDGSLERRSSFGLGLNAYKKEPKNKFKGTVYVIIGPTTYSGASEFSNMMYSQGLATFIGQETGGGYYGNTSGYVRKLVLPNSKITIDIPALQFIMNVEPKLPFGSGVVPHYTVVPTVHDYVTHKNVCLEYVLKLIDNK